MGFSMALGSGGDVPPVSVELVLYRVLVCALLDALADECGPEVAERFLRRQAELLADEQSLETVIPIRGRSEQQEVVRARRGAVAMFRRYLPVFVAKLRPRI